LGLADRCGRAYEPCDELPNRREKTRCDSESFGLDAGATSVAPFRSVKSCSNRSGSGLIPSTEIKRFAGLAAGARGIRNSGVTRSLFEGKRPQMLEIFRVAIRLHPPENEFAFGSVRFLSLTLNSGVARTRLGCETSVRRTQVVQGAGRRSDFIDSGY
jgi:hypothetical protein